MIGRWRRVRATPTLLVDIDCDAVHTLQTPADRHTLERNDVVQPTANALWGTVDHVLSRRLRGVRQLCVHLADRDWTVARLQVSDGDDPRQAMRAHLASSLPEGLDAYTYATHVSRPSGGAIIHAFISQNHVVEGLVERAKDAKLKVRRVQPRIVSLINAVSQRSQLESGLMLIVDRSPSAIAMAVVRNGELERCRIVPQPEVDIQDDIEIAHLHATAEAYGAARQQPLATLATPRATPLFREPERVQTLKVRTLDDPNFGGIQTALYGLTWTEGWEGRPDDS